MKNEEFKKIFKDKLSELGFKNRANHFKLNTSELEKIVYLQKSNFSNLYYVNFGFNLNNLDYKEVTMHIFDRLPNSDVFDLEINIPTCDRKNEIEKIIDTQLIPKLQKINSEHDIKSYLKLQQNLNTVPLKVKKHLGLQ